MTPFAVVSSPAAGELALAAVLAAAGFYLLLPRPRGRSVAGGTAALIAAAAVLGAWAHKSFGEPGPDRIGRLLFILFSTGAVGFGSVLAVQRNPARGAIAFAFVILSTCGLFLLLAAPFLMAATIIVYAGAIVVTFLFVLMLSSSDGPSDENDRSREPLLGSLAGFAFAGLVLFTLYETHEAATPSLSANIAPAKKLTPLPAVVMLPEERHNLRYAASELSKLDDDAFYGDPAAVGMTRLERTTLVNRLQDTVQSVVGVTEAGVYLQGSLAARLDGYRSDTQAQEVLARASAVRKQTHTAFAFVEGAIEQPAPGRTATARTEVRKLAEDLRLLAGEGELPARNVANLGLVLYADHLLAVELAGTLLLVATIGAVAIAHRKGVVA